MSRYSDCSC